MRISTFLSLLIATTCTLGMLTCRPATGSDAASGRGPATAPAVDPRFAGDPAATAEWERVVAAAKREGQITIAGPPTADAREALTEGFQRRYPEIAVDYSGQSGSAVGPKLLPEREAGKYLTDLVINGTTTQYDLIKAGAMDPLLPLLVGPEARDVSKWTSGKLDFADRAEQYNLVIANIVKAPFAYNPRLVSPGEIRSYRDLLDPKWKGKIVMYDPRSAGVGLAGIQFFYTKEGLGKPFIQQLLNQNITFSREDRQILDWVVHGQYPIALGPPDKTMAEMKSKGITIELIGTEDIAEGSYLTAGVASVGVVNRAPHPNAVKVYLDYLLSAEAQLAFSKAIGYPSRRLDVPTDHLPEFVVPKPGVAYDQNYKEDALDLKDDIAQFLRATLGT